MKTYTSRLDHAILKQSSCVLDQKNNEKNTSDKTI